MRNLIPPFLIGCILAGICYNLTPPLTDQRLTHGNTALTPVRYTIVDIGTLGGSRALPTSINGRGQVTGESFSLDGLSHAFFWEDGRMKDLGTLGGEVSGGECINNCGRIAGSYETLNWDSHAFFYDGRQMIDIGVPGCGNAINSRDQIAGETEGCAFLYSRGKTSYLGALGGRWSAACAINNEGQVVGAADIESCRHHAFLYRSGKMKDLGTLGGSESAAMGINGSGCVVGLSETHNSMFHAFLWKGGAMRDLGAPDDADSGATAINSASQIVGYVHYRDKLNYSHAVLWLRGKMIDLNSVIPPESGWKLVIANGINSSGQIVGYGFREGYPDWRGFLLTAIASDRPDGIFDELL